MSQKGGDRPGIVALRRPGDNRSMVRVSLVAAVLAVGCGSEEPSPPPGDFVVEIGGAADPMTGAGGFRAIDDGAELPLRPGSQGGLHVYVHLRLSPDAVAGATATPVVYREARRESDDVLVSQTEHRGLLVESATVAAWDTDRSLRVFLCPTLVGVGVADEPLRMTVEIRADYDSDLIARGTQRFVPRCPEDDDALCRSLCSG